MRLHVRKTRVFITLVEFLGNGMVHENRLVGPWHKGLTNCERKVHILWGPGLGDFPEFTLGRQCSDSFARAHFTKLEERSEKTD